MISFVVSFSRTNEICTVMNSLNCVSSKSSKKKGSSLEKRNNEKEEVLNMADKPDSESASSSIHESDSLIDGTHVTEGNDSESVHIQNNGNDIEEIKNTDDSASINDTNTGREDSIDKTSCTDEETSEVDTSNSAMENPKKSEIDLEQLGFVEVNESDLTGMSSNSAGQEKVKFDIEVSDESCQVFTEFVDMGSVIGDMKADHSVEEVVEISEDLLVQYLKRHQKKHYKAALRNGDWDIKHNIRNALWFNICHYLHKADDQDMFSEFAADLFPSGNNFFFIL